MMPTLDCHDGPAMTEYASLRAKRGNPATSIRIVRSAKTINKSGLPRRTLLAVTDSQSLRGAQRRGNPFLKTHHKTTSP
jgi:hypothetical protein